MAEKIYLTPKTSNSQAEPPKYDDLYNRLCRMSPAQFNWVIFSLRIPKISIPSPIEPQATRAEAILKFAEKPGGVGLAGVLQVIQQSVVSSPSAEFEPERKRAGWVYAVVIAFLVALVFSVRALLSPAEEAKRCGDQKVQAGEACDDGNTVDDDGCQKDCTITPKKPEPVVVASAPLPPPVTAPASKPAPTNNSGAKELSPDWYVFFDSGTDVFTPESFSTIDEVVSVMENNPELKIRLEGHTDSDGPTTKNFSLSKQRAEAVKSYILTRGVAEDRIETVGCGGVLLLLTNKSEEARKKNRRVEFIDASLQPKPCTAKSKAPGKKK